MTLAVMLWVAATRRMHLCATQMRISALMR